MLSKKSVHMSKSEIATDLKKSVSILQEFILGSTEAQSVMMCDPTDTTLVNFLFLHNHCHMAIARAAARYAAQLVQLHGKWTQL
jgi:hypothetical protein